MDPNNMILYVGDIPLRLNGAVNDRVNEQINDFVAAMSGRDQSAGYYTDRRRAPASKVADDIAVGKKAEFFALLALYRHYGFPSVPVDLEIRRGKKKGWATDLPFASVDARFPNAHVKACSDKTISFCGDFSWTFQIGDARGTSGIDDIFMRGNDDILVLVYLADAVTPEAVVKAIIPWDTAQLHLADPRKASLVGLKKCLYYADLKANFAAMKTTA